MYIRSTLALFALALTAAPIAAQANEEVAVKIGVNDLNLATQRDQNRLKTRVNSAARKVCDTGLRGTAVMHQEAKCVKAALASAQPQVELAIANSQGAVRIAIDQILITG
jgi:UrcA family protein